MKNDYLLHKYLNGEASDEEIDLLNSSEEYKDYVVLAEASNGFRLPDFDHDSNFESILDKRKRRLGGGNSWKRYVMQIAAVAVILVAGLVFLRNSETHIETDIAEKQSIELPDGSLVELNAASEISYNKKKWAESRQLTLSGEAYFKVEKGQKFSVNTPEGVVSVLGTQFNVFMRDSVLSVVCYEGLVAVGQGNRIEKLSAGKSLRITNGRWGVISEETVTEPAWLHGESVFNDVTLSNVLAELNNYYNLTIILKEPALNQLQFTGSFPHNNLEVALRSICEPLKIQFEINNDRVNIYAP